MKKRLLILGLIMMLVLTACGGNDKAKNTETAEQTKVSEEEKNEIAEEFVEGMNSDVDDLMYTELDKESNIILTILKDTTNITNPEPIENSFMDAYEFLKENTGYDFIIRMVYESDRENPILEVEKGKFSINKLEELKEKSAAQTTEAEATEDVYTTDKYKFEFTKFEVVDSKYGDGKKMLAITMNFTNNSTEAESPWMAMALEISSKQETDISVEELNGGNAYLPDSYNKAAADLWMVDIKPNTTVEVVLSYELVSTNPVKLMDRFTEGSKYTLDVNVE